MKKVYLQAYLNHNFGDDLFLESILKRYPQVMFYTLSMRRYNNLKYKNIKMYPFIIDYFLQQYISKNSSIEKKLQKKSNLIVLIGGSVFMQGHKTDTVIYNNFFNRPYYIIGSNFGPYSSDSFLNNYKNFFTKANDICLRDEKSYNLFKSLENVRMAPDVVFSSEIKSRYPSEKKVLISVIDCKKKAKQIGKNYQSQYISKLVEIIQQFQILGYKIVLMSFCKAEGDENTIGSLIRHFPNSMLETYCYDGDIDRALEIIDRCEVVVGTRFHATVLAMMLNKVIIPIIYNNKTENLLNDIQFQGIAIHLKNIDKFNVSEINLKNLQYKYCINEIRKKSQEQFLALDSILKCN